MVEAAPAGSGPLRRTFLVPEIKSLDQYDFSRAKAAASLAWVLRAAFGGAEHVPPELWEPFYTDQYAQEHVKPPVTRLLLSAELYCRAWRQALPQLEPSPSPSALLALLARRGTVPSLPEHPVREADLKHQPILMGAHLAVIDALMVAFSFEWTKTLPGPLALSSLEHKLLFWVDTTVRRLQEKTEQEAAQRASPAAPLDGASPAQPSCPTRWYWKLVPHAIAFCLKESGNKPPMIRYRKDRAIARRAPCFPNVTTLQDLASGAALAATIHCYCPQLLRLEEVCLKDPMSVADSLYNLQLVQDFCASHLPRGCPLSLEDLLYVPPPLKVNLVVLLAEMYMCFEVLKPDFVQAKDLPDGHVAVSPRNTETVPSQNNSGSSSPVFNFRHPLLSPGGPQSPLRGSTGSLKSSPSMSHMEALGKAWNRQLSRPLSQAVSFSTPFGLDSDVDVVMGDPVLLRSVSSDSLGPPRPVSTSSRNSAQPAPESGDLPTIEEALQIIHSAEPRLLPDGAADGSFYLHSPEGLSKPPLSPYPPEGASKPLSDRLNKAPIYISHPENPSKSSPCSTGEILKPPPPSEGSPKAVASSPAANNSEVKMTSFAERKKQLVKAEAESGLGSPTSTPVAPEALSSEMSELGARLEEKRRAIEAQKRRIEAIFAKHRQRLGKSAFLQVQPREAAGEAEEEAELGSVPGGERPAGEGQGEPSLRHKSVTFSPDLGPVPPEGLGDYNRAVSKLSAALSSLQRDMQRLTDQQQRLLAPPEAPGPAPPPAAWVIPGPATGPKAASPSPARRAPAARRSPGPGPSPTPRSPKHARPAELKLAPLTRVLTPPHDVDSLPHLRKFSPSQVPVQTRSSILLSEGTPPEEPTTKPALIEIPLASLGEPAADEEGDGSPPGAEDSLEEEASSEGEPRSGLGFFYKDEDKPEDEMAQKRASLLERQQRRVEEARRRKQWQEAEKEQKREEAARLAQEAPGLAFTTPVVASAAPVATLAPTTRAMAPAEEEVGPRRGDFTRLEYERRAQLKLMDDLDKVLRPRASGTGGPGRGGRRATRPRSGCCDDSALARSPARGLLGSRLSKVYSQSTLSLSTVANEAPNNLGVKRPTSRAPSPSGLMSPSRLPGSRERDWENGSNASSPASVPEYTGPRLYKEPSAKSNKFIIHNALSHCCLAGKVNEPQKNRILEEIEKSKANHFLILFRDSSCQFRALYTLSGETEELSRLAGYGPRTVTPAMVEGIYKYNSDRKRFTQIPAKTMSMSVDAFTIQGHLWQSKKPTTPKKGGGTPK
ncbi:calmodulin-regulated spectrin-associated protein 3 isoform 6 [Mus musculus]|uniref:Isoform 14 of Calmodulin-regulated spectrin-associated protein 3 n=2 Tax=Mus musculus TaxID=10090 RepID=Q80VC9-14|nr:calmodulin-regulated spectrin-associated protein 3 isoform 6 [Mus musculus]AGX24909.1 marshalin-La transcript variant 1 [Mus musculus]|eukprot:XP_006508937.1 PREDICTED: calmodulin-regulated spectrin-associated protein 3 isoform X1 [Mus musculus]